MCRMFGYAAPRSSSALAELGAEGVTRLEVLARLHADGWGWAGSAGDEFAGTRVEKSSSPAAADPNFRSALSRRSRAAMVHLRWATMGLPVEESNTHPFERDGITFEHNGSLKPINRMRQLLDAQDLAAMRGQTDSEMYFSLILRQFRAGVSMAEATASAARRIRDHFPVSSLNAMMLTPEQLIVVNSSARSRLDDEDIVEATRYNLPEEHDSDYFALRWHRSHSGAVMVASSGLSDPKWEPVPEDTVMVVNLTDCTVDMIPLVATPASLT